MESVTLANVAGVRTAALTIDVRHSVSLNDINLIYELTHFHREREHVVHTKEVGKFI